MFTHLIVHDNRLIRVAFSEFAKRHFLKNFEKKYRGRQWEVTVESILEDIGRIKMQGNKLEMTQQVDELWYKDGRWIFKYDFAVAQTRKSAKSSGNRCVVFLDSNCNEAEILVIYHKDDLPKNMGEQAWIKSTLINTFSDKMLLF